MKRFLIFLAIVIIPGTAYAHPESGFLPDAVAEMEYRIVLDLNPKDIKTRNKLGIVLYRKKKLKEAEEEFLKVLKRSAGDFDAHDGIGLVRLKQGRYTEAVSWFLKAAGISPGDTMVYYHLGTAYENLDKLAEAKKFYKKAMEVNSVNILKSGSNAELEKGKKKIIMSALESLEIKLKNKEARR